MQLSVFQNKYRIDSLEKLRSLLTHRHEEKYGAFRLSKGKQNEPALELYINDDQACMFFYREAGDPGFHSFRSDSENLSKEIGFLIVNYQLDYYLPGMVVPTPQAVAAFEEFFETGAQPAAVRWHEL